MILGLLLVLVYLVYPAAAGVVALLPGRANVGSPPPGFAEITLTANDGVPLQGWYRAPENGAAIILLHGAGGSRATMRGYAEMLARHGFGVLAVDLRGHGQSQGATNRLGWQGTLDVGAAVQFLQSRADVQRIGGLGSSMGGEVLLGAASAYPQIAAIVADGATARSIEEMLALETNRPLVRNFTARVMMTTVQLLSGQQPPKPLLDSMIEADATQFLLIAGGANAREVAYNQLFQATLGDRAALWIAPDAAHTAAFVRHPEEYERRVLDFLQAQLVNLR
ncbi:MAG: alpha/beta fold hydrolase [Caldilinea sp.]|nr:alpha/beta fold hydrolase [Caldilinea sp.]